MKTIAELCQKHLLERSTLLKAAQEKRIPGYQSGATWLIDEESPDFTTWLNSRKRRTFAPTIEVETPDAPDWMKHVPAAVKAWNEKLTFRCEAASAETDAYREYLLHEAIRLYGDL